MIRQDMVLCSQDFDSFLGIFLQLQDINRTKILHYCFLLNTNGQCTLLQTKYVFWLKNENFYQSMGNKPK